MIYFKEKIGTIEDQAFYSRTALGSVIIVGDVPEIGAEVFFNTYFMQRAYPGIGVEEDKVAAYRNTWKEWKQWQQRQCNWRYFETDRCPVLCSEWNLDAGIWRQLELYGAERRNVSESVGICV